MDGVGEIEGGIYVMRKGVDIDEWGMRVIRVI